MLNGYLRKFSQIQCGIQLSRINLGEIKVLKNAFFRLSREPKIPNFGNPGTTSKYTGFITNLPFWATRRLEPKCSYFSPVKGIVHGSYALNVKLTSLSLQIGWPSFQLISWRKSALIQKLSAQMSKTFH